jgi:DNA repair protein RadA/Sms
MEEVVALQVTPAGVVVPETQTRGKLSDAIARGTKVLRRRSGIPKLDRVLGGGYVDKTSILLAGEPGAGKSTLMLQACIAFAGPVKRNKKEQAEAERLRAEGHPEMAADEHRALYVSGEEAFEQVGARASRLAGALEKSAYIEFVSTRSVPEIMGAVLDVRPHLTIVDSIQEVGDELLSGRFGGENQSANVIRSVMKAVREVGFGTVVFIGHIKKDGDIAGAKKAEHLVDVVTKLMIDTREEESEDGEEVPEDEKVYHDERLLEAQKNRYGSIMDRSTFTMSETGMH